MNKKLGTLLLVVIIVATLGVFAYLRAPKEPPPTTDELWAKQGVPVTVGEVRRGLMDDIVEVVGDIKALQQAEISAKIPGKVAEVYFREGEYVKKGQTIVLLDGDDAKEQLIEAQGALKSAQAALSQAKTNADVTKIQTDAAIQQAEANYAAARAQLAVAKDPLRSQQKRVAKLALDRAEASFNLAKANFESDKQLYEQGAISRIAFNQSETQFISARTQYESAREEYNIAMEGGRSEEVMSAQSNLQVAKEALRTARANAATNRIREEQVKSARASVERAQAAVSLARQNLSYTKITAPFSGQLSMREVDPGQVIGAGQTIAKMVNLDTVYFEGEISENYIDKVDKGQTVTIHIDALDGTSLEGEVEEVYPAGSTASRNFPVRIKFLETSKHIRPAMFARGEVLLGYVPNALIVPKSAVDTRTGTSMVFKVGNKKVHKKEEGKKQQTKTIKVAERIEIEVPRSTPEKSQIIVKKGDLQAGDKIVVKGVQNLDDDTKLNIRKNDK